MVVRSSLGRFRVHAVDGGHLAFREEGSGSCQRVVQNCFARPIPWRYEAPCARFILGDEGLLFPLVIVS